MLPESDRAFLEERGIEHQVASEAGMLCIVFPVWQLPPGYDRTQADLLVRLPPGYPDVAPDMWWFDPAIHLANGSVIPATEYHEPYLGRTWQRWSRHLQPGQWQAGIDGLASYLALLRSELARSIPAGGFG